VIVSGSVSIIGVKFFVWRK